MFQVSWPGTGFPVCNPCCQKQVQSLIFININNLGELVVQKQGPYENMFVLTLSEKDNTESRYF